MQVMETVAMVKSLSQSAAALTTASTLTTEAAAAATSAMHDARRLASVLVDLGSPSADEVLSQIAAPLGALALHPPVPPAVAAPAGPSLAIEGVSEAVLMELVGVVRSLEGAVRSVAGVVHSMEQKLGRIEERLEQLVARGTAF
jgi:hypothetical protein